MLATQYVESSPLPYSWIACDSQDTDAVLLLEKVMGAISEHVDSFAVDATLQLAYRSPLNEETLSQVLSSIRFEFERLGPEAFVLVVDDSHLLVDSPLSRLLLGALRQVMGASTQLVSISRFPLLSGEERLFPAQESILIDNDLLSFSHEEIALRDQ